MYVVYTAHIHTRTRKVEQKNKTLSRTKHAAQLKTAEQRSGVAAIVVVVVALAVAVIALFMYITQLMLLLLLLLWLPLQSMLLSFLYMRTLLTLLSEQRASSVILGKRAVNELC